MKVTREQYEVLKFMADAHGGVGSVSMFTDQDLNCPRCAYGLAWAGGLIKIPASAETHEAVEIELFNASSRGKLPFDWLTSDQAVMGASGRTFNGKLPFEEWAAAMGLEVEDEVNNTTEEVTV